MGMLSGFALPGHAAAEIVGWGRYYDGSAFVPMTVPADVSRGLSNVIAIAAGGSQWLALTEEGRVTGWGSASATKVPPGLSNVVAIAAGQTHSLALTRERRVVAWGDYRDSWTGASVSMLPPSTLKEVVAITAGAHHNLALTAAGGVVAWGADPFGEATVPVALSNVVAIAAGAYHSLALTAGGRVVAWGAGATDDYSPSWSFHQGQSNVPDGLSHVVAIAAGNYHSVALTEEGKVVTWGHHLAGGGRYPPMTVPAGVSNVVAIGSAASSVLALTDDGRVLAWGAISEPGPTNLFHRLSGVVAVVGGDDSFASDHGLALVGAPPGIAAPRWTGPRFLVATAGQPFHHRVMVKNGVDALGASGLPIGLTLDPVRGVITGVPVGAGEYSIGFSATNSLGSTKWDLTLWINGPPSPVILSDGLVRAGLGCGFHWPLAAKYDPEWFGATGLPAGLAIQARTGVISGVPVEWGDFPVSLVASNRNGLGMGSLLLRVSPVISWGSEGATNVPGGLSDVVAIAGTGVYGLALTAAGRVVAWGGNPSGVLEVPVGLSNAVAIAAGGAHNLALTSEGLVLAWGANQSGQVTVPSGLSNVVAIAAGYGHSLALTSEGRLVAWGENSNGQATVPPGLRHVVAIAAGSAYSVALTAEGQVMAWGQSYGPAHVLSGLSNVVSIAAFAGHSMALTAAGRVVAWGEAFFGVAEVPEGLSNVVAIAGGLDGGALTAEGRVVGWRVSKPGQVGYSSPSPPPGLSNAVAIATGYLALTGLPPGSAPPARTGPRFLMATEGYPFQHRILVRNGATAFGASGLPQGLALDTRTGLITGLPQQGGRFEVVLSATNSTGATTWNVTLFVNGPSPSITSSGVVQAGIGSGFSWPVAAGNQPQWFGASGLPAGLAIDSQTGVISGVAREMGDFAVSLVASNRYGLGTGSLTLRVSPVVAWGAGSATLVPAGLSNVVAIAAGGEHGLALNTEGRVAGWGAEGWSEARVPDGLSNVVAIAAGGGHDLALTAQGRVVGWETTGQYESTPLDGLRDVVAMAPSWGGTLALTVDGRVLDSNHPPILEGLSNVVAIAAGASGHRLALTTGGRVLAWGDNTKHQANVPVGLSNVVAIAAGYGHSLALTSGGCVVGWGDNESGQATAPANLSNVVAIAAGWQHSLALTSEGRVVTWGRNKSGQMTVPPGLNNVVAIAAGYTHSMALLHQPAESTPRLRLRGVTEGLEFLADGAPGVLCQLLLASNILGPWRPGETVTFTNRSQPLSPRAPYEPAQFFRLLRR